MKAFFQKSVFVFIACIFIFLPGCSRQNKKIDKNTRATLVIGGWPAGDTAIEAILPGFKELYPNITVEMNFINTAEHHQQLLTALSAGQGAADVVMVEHAWIGRFKDSGGFENLLAEPYNAGNMKQDFVEYKWDIATSSDRKKLVGLVWDIGPISLFYRRDLFKDAGLPTEPEEVETLMSTLEGIMTAAKKIYIPNKRWLFFNASSLFTNYYMNRDFYNEKLELQLEKPGSKEALRTAIEMRRQNLDARITDIWTNEAHALLGSGQIGAVVVGCWYGGFLKSWIAPDTGGKWGVTRMPGGAENANWGGSYLAIPSQSKNKELAWEFIKYALATKKSQNIMFEKVDYFPGYIPAWDDPVYQAEDPYFGNQKTKQLWVDIAKKIEPSFSTLMDSTVESVLNNAVETGINEGKNAEEILAYAKKEIENAVRQDRERFIDILKESGRW